MTVDVTGRRGARALAVTLCLGAATLAGPAQAQFFGWNGWDNGGWNGLPGPAVRRTITAQGFRVLGPLRRNGNVFVADVIDRRGRHERLIVGAADAQILQRFYVDDGRNPGLYARGDESDGMVPPADIPGVPRPSLDRPRSYAQPPSGPLGQDERRAADPDDPDTAVVAPPPLRSQPPIRVVRPGPRVVERAPESPAVRNPAAVESSPLAPAAPRPRAVEPPARAAAPKAPPPAAVASRPDAAPPATPGTPPASSAPSHRMADPLAIPGGPARPADAPPVRSVSGSVTGAPAPTAPAAPAPAAVPAAPLD